MAYDPDRDPFRSFLSGASVSAQAATVVAIVPNDATDLNPYPKAIYIGVSGDIRVIPMGAAADTPVTFKAHPVGYMPVRVRRVYATGTTATDILALGV